MLIAHKISLDVLGNDLMCLYMLASITPIICVIVVNGAKIGVKQASKTETGSAIPLHSINTMSGCSLNIIDVTVLIHLLSLRNRYPLCQFT